VIFRGQQVGRKTLIEFMHELLDKEWANVLSKRQGDSNLEEIITRSQQNFDRFYDQLDKRFG
jgi:hypothetical protein